MKGQLGRNHQDSLEIEPEIETWSLEMIKKRSEELQLLDSQGGIKSEIKRSESRCEEVLLSDHEQSPSKSTTTESQVRSLQFQNFLINSMLLGDSTFKSSCTRNDSCL